MLGGMAPQQYGPASVQYNDWTGTVACDDPHDGMEQIREFARVPEEWSIVAIEMGGGAEAGSDRNWGWVLAVDKNRVAAAGDLPALAVEGAVPVKRFRVLESDAVGVLNAMKRWTIHLHRSGLDEMGLTLEVEEDADDIPW
jgi:hypothetical protein